MRKAALITLLFLLVIMSVGKVSAANTTTSLQTITITNHALPVFTSTPKYFGVVLEFIATESASMSVTINDTSASVLKMTPQKPEVATVLIRHYGYAVSYYYTWFLKVTAITITPSGVITIYNVGVIHSSQTVTTYTSYVISTPVVIVFTITPDFVTTYTIQENASPASTYSGIITMSGYQFSFPGPGLDKHGEHIVIKVNDTTFYFINSNDAFLAGYSFHGEALLEEVSNTTTTLYTYTASPASYFYANSYVFLWTHDASNLTIELIGTRMNGAGSVIDTRVILSTVIQKASVLEFTFLNQNDRDTWWLDEWLIGIPNLESTTVNGYDYLGVSGKYYYYASITFSTETDILQFILTDTENTYFTYATAFTKLTDTNSDLGHQAAANPAVALSLALIGIAATYAAYILTRSVSYALFVFYTMTAAIYVLGVKFTSSISPVLTFVALFFVMLFADLFINVIRNR